MYEYIEGSLKEHEAQSVVVDVNGIGYRILVPINIVDRLPLIGEKVFFYISFIVRDVSHTLFGFLQKEERELFEKLITFSGIGPKTALSLLGHLERQRLYSAVVEENTKLLATVPGIGKKTAERLLIDLKSYFKDSPLLSQISHNPIQHEMTKDGVAALVNLGYTQSDAKRAIQKVLLEFPLEKDLSLIIQKALQFQLNN